MPRPRFHKLPADQQQAILRAALDEFAAHGFNDASLNQIIDASGISKGSMYYYFDSKADLFAHVTRVELGRLMQETGPFPVPSARDPARFWSTLEEYALRLLGGFVAAPRIAALTRSWLAAQTNPELQQAQRDMERALSPWFEQAMVAGQRARAVRSDVPLGLLMAVVFGMGHAMDMWLMTQDLDAETSRAHLRVCMEMIRDVLSPEGKRARPRR